MPKVGRFRLPSGRRRHRRRGRRRRRGGRDVGRDVGCDGGGRAAAGAARAGADVLLGGERGGVLLDGLQKMDIQVIGERKRERERDVGT